MKFPLREMLHSVAQTPRTGPQSVACCRIAVVQAAPPRPGGARRQFPTSVTFPGDRVLGRWRPANDNFVSSGAPEIAADARDARRACRHEKLQESLLRRTGPRRSDSGIIVRGRSWLARSCRAQE